MNVEANECLLPTAAPPQWVYSTPTLYGQHYVFTSTAGSYHGQRTVSGTRRQRNHCLASMICLETFSVSVYLSCGVAGELILSNYILGNSIIRVNSSGKLLLSHDIMR